MEKEIHDKKKKKDKRTMETTNDSNVRKRLNRGMGVSTNVVQKLYQTCKDVFTNGGDGFVPPPADIQRLKLILDSMTAEDVCLSPNKPYFKTTYTEATLIPITYIHLHECDHFSIGIFCFPPSGVIPLHNHPRMTVFSKILFGSMHVQSYDWVNDHPPDPDAITKNGINHVYSQWPQLRLAKAHIDSNLVAPCSTSILYPTAGGNIHCFRALTACAMLDVLGPPYSESPGRHCTYFNSYPCSRFPELLVHEGDSSRKYTWLEEREKPEDFIVLEGKYEGSLIQEKEIMN